MLPTSTERTVALSNATHTLPGQYSLEVHLVSLSLFLYDLANSALLHKWEESVISEEGTSKKQQVLWRQLLPHCHPSSRLEEKVLLSMAFPWLPFG